MERIGKIFRDAGGTFLLSPEAIAEQLKNIKAFVFDWDGVFNDGEKNEGSPAGFSEVDSMGINMLRFAWWLQRHEQLVVTIISGERNAASFLLSTREHYSTCYYKVPDKNIPFTHLCERHNLKPLEIACVYDDVADLAMAGACGLRFMVGRKSNPMFTEHVVKNKLVDYITGSESGNFAVRELCELIIGITGTYDEVISRRSAFTGEYRSYLELRNKIQPAFYTSENGTVVEKNP